MRLQAPGTVSDPRRRSASATGPRRIAAVLAVLAVLAIAVCAAAGTAAVAASAGWPGLRGPHDDGAVRDARLVTGDTAALKVAWMRALGSGYSSVAVVDGRVVTMFADGDADYAAAFDAGTGDELWRYRIADTYAGHDGSHDGPISTPLIAGGSVYGLGPSGQLFALEAATGKARWATHLVDDHGAEAPYYGFTSSPVMAEGVLVVQIGAGEGKTVAGLDPSDGSVLWTATTDEIHYHSPIVATVGGREVVVSAGVKTFGGLDPATGEVLWSYEHGGDDRAMGGATIVPVPAGDGRFFLMNKIDASAMVRVARSGGGYEVTELWSSNSIKSSYVVPVYRDGYIYGINGRILTCVDANTGEMVWRSRSPGDGFPMLVGEHLVIVTKPGTMHVARASTEGYSEIASLELFDEHSWSTVAYADGSLYARSMGHLARIDVVNEAGGETPHDPWVASTGFGEFLAQVAAAEGSDAKHALIDAYLSSQSTFPVVEDTGAVHFVYRGDVEDVGIVGDLIGFRREDPMRRVAGTDLFTYSMRIEPDASGTYGFIPAYSEPVADPLNDRPGDGLFGEVSWFSMPAWNAPDFHGEVEASRRGRLEPFEWDSAVLEGKKRKAQIYLPAGYDADPARRYPVLYVHDGADALEQGHMQAALDNLIGERIRPLIAVFVIPDEEDPRADLRNFENYAKVLTEELVPAVDGRFRTIADPMSRGTVGSGRAAGPALLAAAKFPAMFGRVGIQAGLVGPEDADDLVAASDERMLVIYHEWGTYHMRSPHEAWDLADTNRELNARLRELGHRPSGGEVPDGFGWACWRARTDAMLGALFPMTR